MTDRLTATLLYAPDAYATVTKREDINGRRLAGSSFMRGFLKHASSRDIYCLAMANSDLSPVLDMIRETTDGAKRGVEVGSHQMNQLGAHSVVMRPDPNLTALSFLRMRYGQASASLCGVTHTTAGYRLPDPFLDMRRSPVEPWDGLICTAKTVRQSLDYRFDVVDEFLERRFGAPPPPRPQMPVIPLGINVDEFQWTEADRAKTRAEIGAGEDDIVVMCLARLTPQFKFDPLPFYLAMEQAAAQTKKRLIILFAGYYLGGHSKQVFEKGAAELCPSVPMHVRAADNGDARREAFAAADIFVFPIDNIQETFGLAPIEAMAAGKPVISSDWNGMKDTVTEDVGFRIPTRTVRGEWSADEAYLNQAGYDQNSPHLTLISGMTQIDVPDYAAKIALLAEDDALRARLGAGGERRAREVYDWGRIIPQYEAFWAELDGIRKAASAAENDWYAALDSPVAPPPLKFFSMYPTTQGIAEDAVFELVDGAGPERAQLIHEARRYDDLGRTPASMLAVNAMLEALADAPRTCGELTKAAGGKPELAEKTLIWLLKYDLIRMRLGGYSGAIS